MKMYSALRHDGRSNIDRSAVLQTSISEFLTAWHAAGGRKTPKHHYLRHFGKETMRFGNPANCHTYRDEGHHLKVRQVAKRANSTRFAEVVLSRLSVAFFKNSALREDPDEPTSIFDVVYTPLDD